MTTAATERRTSGLVPVSAMKSLTCDSVFEMINFMFSMGDTAVVAGDRNADVSRAKNDVGHRT